ncbi:MAG: D-alanyl-D-alanine dipeptidase [Ignavibacteria bacterium]|nr:MAG: D-alanyl-D-alanine dipeptidase [Ignavibacteria bacterium]KAF0157956.1 MAG: D-alanyl-D-alanine dipeptidase [Ignavibacteria bacterium]
MKKVIFTLFVFTYISLLAQEDTLIVPLKLIDSTIVQDVRYATTNNFTKQILYPSAKVFLRKIAAEHLTQANEYFKKNHNLRIKIFDGYRPLFVQKIMWAILPDERYVANPAKGSRHNRGAAVDVTLIDTVGNELDMGTPYDDFTERASFASKDVSEKVYANRKLLREGMIMFGFVPLESEWWHFDFKDWKRFGILDTGIN